MMMFLSDLALGFLGGGVFCSVIFTAFAFCIKFIDRMKYQHLSYKPEFLLENRSKKSKK